jgi:hypothetical protein
VSFEFFLDDAPDLIFGGVGIQVAVKTEQAARDEPRKPGGKSGDGVNDLAGATTRCRVNYSAGVVEGKIIEALDHLAEESSPMNGVEMGRERQQLMLENERDHVVGRCEWVGLLG